MSIKRITGRTLQARRLRIWTANPHCAMCGALVSYPSGFELDHVQSLDKQGSDTEDNCQVLCIDVDGVKVGCHRIKTQKEMGYKGDSQPRVKFDDNGRVVW